jgi:Tfp pilus assembly protein PilF
VGDLDGARPLLDAALEREPDHLYALQYRAKLRLHDNNAIGAEKDSRRLLSVDPYNPEAQYTLALSIQRQAGREKEAAEAMARTEQLRADSRKLDDLLVREVDIDRSPEVTYEVGVLFLKLGNDQQGLRWLYRTLEIDPKHRPSHERLLEYFEETGDERHAAIHRAALK